MTAENPRDPSGPAPDLAAQMSRRCAEYRALWDGAAAKFARSSYRSADLLDDWFALCGMLARDMTAGAALWWTAGNGPRPGRHPGPGSRGGTREP